MTPFKEKKCYSCGQNCNQEDMLSYDNNVYCKNCGDGILKSLGRTFENSNVKPLLDLEDEMIEEIDALSEEQVLQIQQIIKKCQFIGLGSIIGLFCPVLLPLLALASLSIIKKRNDLLRDPVIENALKTLKGHKKKELRKLAEKNNRQGFLASLLIEQESLYVPIGLVAIFIVIILILFAKSN